MRSRLVLSLLSCAGVAALATSPVVLLASAASGAPGAAGPSTAVAQAISFIAAQQRSDGGFGSSEAGFPGFETPDALLAIGAAAQTGSAWNAGEARSAVEAVRNNGHSGLHYLDDWADGAFGAINAGGAARIAVVAVALGLDPASFDPDHDGAANLVSMVSAGEQPDGTWGVGALNTTLTAVLALRAVGHSIDASTVAAIDAAQQANGAWNFAGDPKGTDIDPDTTGLAIEALIAAGVSPTDAAVQRGVAFLAGSQATDGAWSDAFAHAENPNSTALGALGVIAAGYDPATRCWRDQLAPARAGLAYASPQHAILATQQSDGRFASPNDSFGINTFATAQGVQAVVPGYQPVVRAAPQPCTTPPVTTTTTAAPTTTAGSNTTVAGQGVTTTTSTGAGTLPLTGRGSSRGALFAALLLVAGGALTLVGRRRVLGPQ